MEMIAPTQRVMSKLFLVSLIWIAVMERSEISAPGSQIARDVRASRLTLYIALLCDHGILLTDGFTQIIDKLQQSFVVNKSVTMMKQTLWIDNLRLGNLPQTYA
jgi:hypothetical protein